MDVHETTPLSPQYSVPFLPNLVTVFPSLSSSGKSHLVKQIIKNPEDYFVEAPTKVIVVLCNSKVEPFQYYKENHDSDDISNNEQEHQNNLEDNTTVVLLQDFAPETDLEFKTLLVFEDVQTLSEKITNCINIYCHHLNLAGIFILVQGLLGQSRVFPLLTLSHRVVLFLQSTAVSRLANYILQFYQDQELRAYIKQILALAQRNEDVVLLEINKVRGTNQPFYVAIQGLDRFPKSIAKRPVFFPQPNKLHTYREMFSQNYAETEADSESDLAPPGSFILVPAENVFKKQLESKDGEDTTHGKDNCQMTWNKTLNTIKENLEYNFPRNKLLLAENLLREIMRTEKFCVTNDGRTIFIKDAPKTKTPLLDLISNIVRQAGPNEMPNPKYVLFVKILIQNGAPLLYFKNKSLLGRRHPVQTSSVKSKLLSKNFFVDG